MEPHTQSNIRGYFVRYGGRNAFSALTLLVGRQEGHPACKKTEQWGAGVVICLERGADLHTAQLMPLPLAVSCSSKIQIGFTFLIPAHPRVVPDKGPLNGCVCLSGTGAECVRGHRSKAARCSLGNTTMQTDAYDSERRQQLTTTIHPPNWIPLPAISRRLRLKGLTYTI